MDNRLTADDTTEDLSPLAWVEAELRKALDQAHRNLRRFAKDAAGVDESQSEGLDTAILRQTRAQLHQSAGALELVGMGAAARTLKAAEQVVQRFIQKPWQLDGAAVDTVERGSFAVLDLVGRVLQGRKESAVGLFPQYRALQELAGADRVHPADLWEHAWNWTDFPDDPQADAPATVLDEQTRTGLERDMLHLMRGVETSRAASRLADMSDSLARGAASPETRTLWHLAAAFYEGLAGERIPLDIYAKRMSSRLLAQCAKLQRGESTVSDRLAQDLLFFNATAPGEPLQRMSRVLQTFRLKPQPASYDQARFGRFDPATLSQARKRVQSAKEGWSAVAGGELARIASLPDLFGLLGESVKRIYPQGDILAGALSAAVDQTIRPGRAPGPELAMEVATAVLYLEASLEEADFDSPELAARMGRLTQRLRAVSAGQTPDPLESWMEELYRRVSDRQTMGSVVHELRVALGEVEQVMDNFFRDPTDTAALAPVAQRLDQMRGVLSVLGLKQAAAAVVRMRNDVDAMVAGHAPKPPDEQPHFQRLAANLGALSFLIDMLGYQPALAKNLFVFDEATGELRPLMGREEGAESRLDFASAATPEVAQTREAAERVAQDDLSPDDLSQELARIYQEATIAEQTGLAATAREAAKSLAAAEDPQSRAQVVETVKKAMAPVPVAPPAPVADSQELDDDDLLAIFLEEAADVVASGRHAISALQRSPSDIQELTTLRRAFHTLKGSSRMVGLTEFGDAAWACEQVFNAWLADQKPAEPDLLTFAQDAMEHFQRWARDVSDGRAAKWKAAPIRQAADSMRQTRTLIPIAAGMAASGGPSHAPFEATIPVDELLMPEQPASASAPLKGAATNPQPDELAGSPGDGVLNLRLDLAEETPGHTPATPSRQPPAFSDIPVLDDVPTLGPLLDGPLAFSLEAPDDAPAGEGSAPAADLPVPTDPVASFTAGDAEPPAPDEAVSSPEVPAADLSAPTDEERPLPVPDVSAPGSLEDDWRLFEESGIGLPGFAAPVPPSSLALAQADVEPFELPAEAEATPPAARPDDTVDAAAALDEAAEEAEASLSQDTSASPQDSLHHLLDDAASGALDTDDDVSRPLTTADSARVGAAMQDLLQHIDLDLPSPLPDVRLDQEPLVQLLHPSAHEPGSPPAVKPDPPAVATDGTAQSGTMGQERDAATPADDQVKVIGSLRIGIPLFNIYLPEADEHSRRLLTEIEEWTMELHRPVSETAVALAHSLAGSSATVGFAALSALARRLEHALTKSQALGHGRTEDGVLFRRVAEEVRRLLHQFAAGFLREPDGELVEELAAYERAADEALAVRRASDDVAPGQGQDDEEPFRFHWKGAARRAGDGFASTTSAPLFTPTVSAGPHDTMPASLPELSPVKGQRVHVTSRAGGLDIDEDIDAEDAVDADLFPIFEEEAQDLLPQLASEMRQWSQRPADESAANACMRTLHTLKGGARLAGAMRLGELAHRLESKIERLLGRGDMGAEDVEPLMSRVDVIQGLFELLQKRDAAAYNEAVEEAAAASQLGALDDAAQAGARVAFDSAPPPTPEPTVKETVPPLAPAAPLAQTPSEGVASTDPPSSDEGPPTEKPPAQEQAGEAPAQAQGGAVPVRFDWTRFRPNSESTQASPVRPAGAQGAVRVRAQLLDRLVNQAGEVSITRARLETEVGAIRGSVSDLTDNLDRLREQLRDIELQADTQMASRMEAAKQASETFDPLEFDRFTRFQELTRMMAESVNDVATVQRQLQRTVASTEDELAAQARLTRELQSDLLRTRMVEFESLSERLYRVVRQAAKETGKQVRLDIVGGTIEVDRGVLERMTPAFEHLLRNGVTHGIEAMDRRRAADKDPVGLITVSLHQEGNEVAVEFRDDGAGLDLPAIRHKATSAGLMQADAPLDDASLANLIFMPGFSTAETVTELAGRGVGMDVVRSEINGMGGRIETATSQGQGTSFRLVLPLTTAVTQIVLLRVGSTIAGVPGSLVELVRRSTAQEMADAYEKGSCRVGSEDLPFFWLGALLQLSGRGQEGGRHVPMVLLRSAQQRLAVHVDEVLGNQEVVVKNLGPQLSRLPGLAGMTLLASGAITLIYNPVALAAVYGAQARALSLTALHGAVHGGEIDTPKTLPAVDVPLILVVDDSLTVRRVTQRLLAREGYRIVLAKDGLEALEKLQDERPAVVLSDIEMPRMDGFDLLRNIRHQQALKDLPVIMITSRIAQKHRDYAQELGANHYLGKPYSEDELLRLIARYVNVAQQDRSATRV